MMDNELLFSVPMIVPLGIAYAAVLILSLLGNIVVLLIVARNSQMRSMIDLFICNLSTADILVAIMVLPLTFFQNIWRSWHFGQAMCKTFPYLQGVTVGASIMTLTVVAFDRYMAICHPLKRLITRRHAKWIILSIWLVSCATLTPWAISFTQEEVNATAPNDSAPSNVTIIVCYDKSPSNQAFFISWIVFGLYIIPLLLITSFYTAIAYRIWDRIKASDVNANSTQPVQLNTASKAGAGGPRNRGPALRTDGGLNKKKTVKIVKMLVVVVVLFGVSRLPFYIYVVVDMFLNISSQFSYFSYVLAWLQWLVSSNCCVNPWVYCLYSKKYRAGFKNILFCIHGRPTGRTLTLDTEHSRQLRSTAYTALAMGERPRAMEREAPMYGARSRLLIGERRNGP